MKYLPASAVLSSVSAAASSWAAAVAIVVIAAASTAASAQTQPPVNSDQCAIAYVTGVGGSEQSVREYLATPHMDQYRYLTQNDIQCQVSDEGRASGCTGITSLQNEKVSVYGDIDNTLMSVVARVELDHGTYPVIIAVPRQDVKCAQQ